MWHFLKEFKAEQKLISFLRENENCVKDFINKIDHALRTQGKFMSSLEELLERVKIEEVHIQTDRINGVPERYYCTFSQELQIVIIKKILRKIPNKRRAYLNRIAKKGNQPFKEN